MKYSIPTIIGIILLVSCQDKNPMQFPNKIYASKKAMHYKFDQIPYDTLSKGVLRKLVYGDNLQQTGVIVKKGFFIPKHKHVSEQMSTVLQGKLKVTVFYPDNEEVTNLNKGDVFFIPSNIPHLYEAIEDSEILETFFPVRQDMIKKK